MKISTRTMLGAISLTVFTVLASAGSIGILTLKDSGKAIEANLEKQFHAIAVGRQTAIDNSFAQYQDLLSSLARGRMTQEALYGLIRPFGSYRYEVGIMDKNALSDELQAWYQNQFAPHYREQSGGIDAPVEQWLGSMSIEAKLIQHFYLQTNPGWPNQLAHMSDRSDATIYGQQHRKYHASFRDLVQRFELGDLMLVDHNSQKVIYSVNKGPQLGTSLIQGPFKNTSLASLVKQLRQAPDQFAISDFTRSPFSFNRLSGFMGVAVYHDAHSPERPVGYLIAEVPASLLDQLVSNQGRWQEMGLGQSGDVYLADNRGRVLTALRAQQQNPTELIEQLNRAGLTQQASALRRHTDGGGWLTIDTPPVRAASRGEAGVDSTQDYLGRTMYTAWQPVRLGGQSYALIVQQSPDEVFAALSELRGRVIGSIALAAAVLILLAAMAAFCFSRYLARPMTRLAATIETAAKSRDLRASFDTSRSDEVGDISRSLNSLFSALSTTLHTVQHAMHDSASTATENAATSASCRRDAQTQRREMGEVDRELDQVGQALQQMHSELYASAEKTRDTSQEARSGKHQMRDVVEQVNRLQTQIAHSGESMQALTDAADAIVAVVDTIKGVAEQTNLLALNAAIEAARAGEHGRGFAVVADEVRRLSASTHDATGEIQQLIDRLRTTVDSTAQGLAGERESAARCVELASATEQSLSLIQRSVADIEAVMARIADQSEGECQRADHSRNALTTLLQTVDHTDASIAQMAHSAERQKEIAQTSLESLNVIRLAEK
ncbi:methyl-accepting chemotaxis protein [Gilvimarinus xylanilyticus]|uniref:Methyl-accepting chemotaxis protein n=1 Tax=Gilvimarinus xylanilyticus TaxID=2944139 RepID=A0A9X2HY50_9GAMM|nr:methyl-accepting chemotaxis protein [Gilvimarinus xylanilyticus]